MLDDESPNWRTSLLDYCTIVICEIGVPKTVLILGKHLVIEGQPMLIMEGINDDLAVAVFWEIV